MVHLGQSQEIHITDGHSVTLCMIIEVSGYLYFETTRAEIGRQFLHTSNADF